MPTLPRSTPRRFRFVAAASGVAIAVALLTAIPPARADDLNPPSWERLGAANLSTSAEWDFLTAQDPDDIQPDGTSVPLIRGDVEPDMNAAFPPDRHPSGTTFGDIDFAASMSNGGYSGGPSAPPGGLAFNVPNWYDQEPLKILRLQVTYSGEEPGTRLFAFIGGVPGTSTGVTVEPVGRVADSDPSLPPGMSYFYEDWRILPNPDWEQVVIDVPSGTFIDQVVIDTISFPEPSSFGLLAVATGGFAAFACGRRRRKTTL